MTRERRKSERLRAGALPDPSSVQGIVELAADLAVYLSPNGEVEGISVNPDCPSLGCLDHWVGRDFKSFLTIESVAKLDERVAEMRADASMTPRWIEINHVDNATWEFPIRYSIHRTYNSDHLLLLGRDMQPIAEVQQRLVSEQLARERDQQRLRSEQTFYNVALEASDTGLIMVEPETGKIRDLNSAAALLLGTKASTLTGSSLAQAFEGRKREELLDELQEAARADEAKCVELMARRNGHSLLLYPDFFRAAGQLFMLCRLVPVDASMSTSAEVAQSTALLFASTSDAIVLTDAKGMVREANESFLVMADAAQMRDIRGTSFADYLARGSVDLKIILEAALKKGRLSNYATKITSVAGTRTSVDISASRLEHQGGDFGFGFVIRSVAPSEMGDGDATVGAVSEDAMKNVMDLVGTASLKELVSATSDVVEKLCIETAVQLTGNNRVAAAEMLGLSRQSLYVKLRKHGIMKSDNDDIS